MKSQNGETSTEIWVRPEPHPHLNVVITPYGTLVNPMPDPVPDVDVPEKTKAPKPA